MSPQQLGLVILAASEVPNFMAGLLPSLFTIQTFSDDPAKVKALRRGEIVGGALALGVGVGASLVAESPWPFVACAVIFGVLIYEYERAIRNPINGGQDMASGYAG